MTHPPSGYSPDAQPAAPPPAPYGYGPAGGQEPYGYPAPWASPPRRRPMGLFVFAAVLLIGAGGLLLTRSSLFGGDDALPSQATAPDLNLPTHRDKASHRKPADKPAEHTQVSGRHVSEHGWSMVVPRSWTPADVPNLNEDAAWRTPGGIAGYGDIVSVLRERPLVPTSLETYVAAATQLLTVGVGGGAFHVVRSHTYRTHGEIEYKSLILGRALHSLVVVVPSSNGSYVSATFAAPAMTYSKDVKRVERILKTLTGS